MRYFVIFGVFLLSFSPLAVKWVQFSPGVSAFYRSFYAALFFLLILFFQILTKSTQIKDSKWIMPSIFGGIFLGIDLIIWHKTIIYLGAGPATFLGNSQIIFMTLFAACIFKEKISWQFFFALGLVGLGLYMMIPLHIQGVTKPIGYLMGIIVGFTYAGMLISLRYAKMCSKVHYPEIGSLCVVFMVSALTIGIYILEISKDSLFSGNLNSHLLMIITAFFCQTIGWYLINGNILKIPAHEGSLLLLFQPILAIVWGILFFNEPFGFIQFLGVGLALFGFIGYQSNLFRYLLNSFKRSQMK